MAFQPVPNVAVCEIRAVYAGSVRVENVLHFEYTGAIDQEALDDLTDAVAAAYIDDFVPLLPNVVVGTEIYARDLSAPIALESANITIGGVAGGTDTPALPANSTLCVSFRTGFTGRSARGRAYVLALVESGVNNNIVSTPYANQWVAAYQDVAATALVAGWRQVIVSRVQEKVTLPEGIAYPVTTVVLTDFNVDSQRRRLNGRGI